MTLSDEPTGLLNVGTTEYEEIPLSDSFSWLKHRIDKFVVGGIYLIAGQPGIGKSTLGIQLALDLGRRGDKTLYVLTEQSKGDLARRARLICSDWPPSEVDGALSRVHAEDGIYDVEQLPTFLAHQVLASSGKYHDVKFIVIDSVQGHGLASAATRKYRQIYEFCRQCKSSKITVLLVAHVTKKGDIAGPKDMEHNVDCVLVMKKALIYRPLFVPKNRFGPAIFKPVPLEMDKKTSALKLAPHSQSVSSVAKTYFLSGLAEVQAEVSLPTYGNRGRITAPGLPRKEIELLINSISKIPDMEIEDLDFSIQCKLPGERRYRSIAGLPLCMALISSYIQKDIPKHHLYLGEVDLLRQVRDVPEDIIISLWENIQNGTIKTPIRIFCPASSAELIKGEVERATIIACERLDDAVFETWPDIRKQNKE